MNRNKIFMFSLLLSCFALFAFIFPEIQSKPWQVPMKYEKLKNPVVDKEDSKLRGKILYKMHCASCHGKTGMGDGVKARRLKTPMPDFTKDEFHKQSDGAMYYKSFIGRDEMPSFEKKIPKDEDRWFLVNYLKNMNCK